MPDVDIVVYPETDYEFDEASMEVAENNKQQKQVVKTLTDYALKEPGTASRRIHLHFLQSPHEVLGEDGKVTGIRMERTALQGDGNVKGTGEFIDYPVQAVYRAVGYYGTAIEGLPFDDSKGTIANEGGRVVDGGDVVPGMYTTGWIKRGPVGLIGHTKSDAQETIANLVEDAERLYAESQAGAQQAQPRQRPAPAQGARCRRGAVARLGASRRARACAGRGRRPRAHQGRSPRRDDGHRARSQVTHDPSRGRRRHSCGAGLCASRGGRSRGDP
ncbi:hypothetical protein GCM10025876_23280 [Demequina litorisediminis]|uniref:Ferredoxin--NADP(+) reductase n=1 Tax=Demequina litorisediminis TaxID=1849022 RepID=A0ABQ6IEJ1_9MICO|nr:hypothetical protein GCM10025876_23280 [Demequina litorisediminis]